MNNGTRFLKILLAVPLALIVAGYAAVVAQDLRQRVDSPGGGSAETVSIRLSLISTCMFRCNWSLTPSKMLTLLIIVSFGCGFASWATADVMIRHSDKITTGKSFNVFIFVSS